MYKFKARIKDRLTRQEYATQSNNLQSLITDINRKTNITFIIVKNHNNQIMMRGTK